MQLPEDDERFLNEQGFDWKLDADGEQAGFLVIRSFDVSGGGFTPSTTDLMVRIPPQYNLAKLDMWYCAPPIKLAATGQNAPNTEVIETYMNRTWQRFSRHLPDGVWKPGVDNLRTYMRFIFRELQGKG